LFWGEVLPAGAVVRGGGVNDRGAIGVHEEVVDTHAGLAFFVVGFGDEVGYGGLVELGVGVGDKVFDWAGFYESAV